jgi:hypothetical protein
MAANKPRPLAERVTYFRLTADPSACWIWPGTKNQKSGGYGTVWDYSQRPRRKVYAHRAVWELIHGPVPDGLFCCHVCDVPSCFNPNHIFLGTKAENNVDMRHKHRHSYGAHHYAARLTEGQVRAILSSSRSAYAEAKRYGVATATIQDVRLRRTWKHITV